MRKLKQDVVVTKRLGSIILNIDFECIVRETKNYQCANVPFQYIFILLLYEM